MCIRDSTKDKLNAIVDAVVYYKIHDPVKATYNVDDHRIQLVSLARTTLRAVIGKMTLTEANENRDEINKQIEEILDKETNSYGVEVLRVELQKIEPPMDVQDSMNKVVKAEQEKIAAMDLASAAEIKADGERRAEIKKAEGVRQAYILKAQGEAQAKVALANAEAEKIKIENVLTKELSEIKVSGAFISIGETPNNNLAKTLNLKLNEKGYIETNDLQETNVEGVYACGDVSGKGWAQALNASTQGMNAALACSDFIRKQ